MLGYSLCSSDVKLHTLNQTVVLFVDGCAFEMLMEMWPLTSVGFVVLPMFVGN